MGKNVNLKLLIVLVLILIGLYKLYPTFRNYTITPEEKTRIEEEDPESFKGAIKLGLDLQGGIRMVLQLDKSKLSDDEQKDALSRALEVIRNRIDQFGVSEPIIQTQGDDRIIVELPGFHNIDRAKKLVGSTAQLEFKLVREADDLGPTLDAVDRVLKKGTVEDSGQAAGTEDEKKGADTAKDKKEKGEGEKTGDQPEDLFESVEEELPDTLTDEQKQALEYEKELQEEHPFRSLLIKAGMDIAVPKKNILKVKRLLSDTQVVKVVSKGVEFAWSAELEGEKGSEFRRLYLLKRKSEITGSYLNDANPNINQGGINAGQAVVNMTLSGDGARRFSKITGANIDKRLAIVLDRQVYSAPVIRTKIPNGRAEITGMGNFEEARDLSIVLRAGALPAPMKIIEERTVGPTLGSDSIDKGIKAAYVGMVLVIIFILIYYKACGFIAISALCLNILFLLSILASMGLTLTLPGIAGIILTIGMAVDANVIINERIKEELDTGKNVRADLDSGSNRAFWTIFDANVTTLITGVILHYYGSGPIKGFAITLIIGILSSMFTAIWVTRQIFNKVTLSFNVKKLII
jgi:protein-export membrane protein SecD